MPTSRDESGFTAAARRASPSFVKRKNSASRTTSPMDTRTIPMSCTLMGTPATSIVRVENGPWNCLFAPPQITLIRPLSSSARPSVTITIVRTGASSTGRMTIALDRHTAREGDREHDGERRPEREPVVHQRPGNERRERRHLALSEVDDARRAIDDHDRERETRVDRAFADARGKLLRELRPGEGGENH